MVHTYPIDDDLLDAGLIIKAKVPDTKFDGLIPEVRFLDERVHRIGRSQNIAHSSIGSPNLAITVFLPSFTVTTMPCSSKTSEKVQ
jgi:hypothetical protein